MMMNGGLYQDVATRVVLDPFSKAHNVTINVIPANSAPMLTRVKAEASSPTHRRRRVGRSGRGTGA